MDRPAAHLDANGDRGTLAWGTTSSPMHESLGPPGLRGLGPNARLRQGQPPAPEGAQRKLMASRAVKAAMFWSVTTSPPGWTSTRMAPFDDITEKTIFA